MQKTCNFPILKTMQKVGGGLLLIPMLAMSILHTFLPQLFEIGAPTQTLFSSESTMALVGFMLFFSGTQCNVMDLSTVFKRYGVLCFIKLLTAVLIGYFMMQFFGYGGIFGISTIALIAVLTSCNPGLFLALMHQYGDQSDQSAFGLLNLIVVPIVPITILNAMSGAGIDWLSIVSTLFPFMLGILLGTLDKDVQSFFKHGTQMLLPFLGICFGARINLLEAFGSGLQGVLITILFYLLSWLPMLGYERLTHQTGVRSCAMSSVAGLSLAVPVLLIQQQEALSMYASGTIAQIAFAVILSSIITPYIVKRLSHA